MELRGIGVEAEVFCTTFGLARITDHKLEAMAAALTRTRRIIAEGYPKDPEQLESATIGLCERLVDRSLDLSSAALCVANASLDAATEAACRAAIEQTVAGLYIMREPDSVVRRLVQYFYAYLDEADYRVTEWEKSAANEPDTDRPMFEAARAQRRAASVAERDFLERVRVELGVDDAKGWPKKIKDRFVQCDLASSYRTIYGALSAQAHGGAEDLVHEFIARSIDSTHEESGRTGGSIWATQRAENRSFALAMAWFTVDLTLELAIRFARLHGLSSAAVALRLTRKEHELEMPDWMPANFTPSGKPR
ncbi:MAG: hypothetical protein KF764_20400 [Labilithrix sp.]|nr:hypothetical protein [Labilithrix sp.]